MFLAKALLYGYVLLLSAIVLNLIASKLKIKSWYDFIKKPKQTSAVSYIWLFLIYPLSLGLAIVFVQQIIK
ncbi:hypothetical protein LBMAG34_1770 [Candidatus Saccharibacteria bacterium]|nr:hypothetical protein LBMAG34_1770 [Candidatus Saccharibacteria bacterium]